MTSNAGDKGISLMKKFCNSPDEACNAVCVDFDGTLPDRGQNRRLNVSGDPRGVGDANIYVFPDGNGGCVTNFKSDQKTYWYTTGAPTVRTPTPHMTKIGENHDPLLLMLWHEAEPVLSHPYLEKKCVKPNKRIRQVTRDQVKHVFGWVPWKLCDPLLCIPLSDGSGLVSMQFIDVNGQKRFLKDHAIAGAYWFTSKANPNKPIGIAEGVATAINVATVNKFPVVAAMSCGNLKAVALKFRRRFPKKTIYLLADSGKGEIEANEAAYVIGAQIAVPPFTEAIKKQFINEIPTDFNDYYRIIGALR